MKNLTFIRRVRIKERIRVYKQHNTNLKCFLWSTYTPNYYVLQRNKTYELIYSADETFKNYYSVSNRTSKYVKPKNN